jgi:hypothetical protein
LSTIGISSSLFSQIASSPSAANQLSADLKQLAQDLQGGNLSAAQQDYVTLSQDALNGSASSASPAAAGGITPSLISDIASSSSSSSSFVSGLNQLGTDLANGDLSAAQGDMLSLDSTALNAAPSSTAAASSAISSKSNQAEIAMLVKATTEAIEAGDQSAIGADMSQLASVSTSSQGASYLQSSSASYGSSSSSSSGSGSGSSTSSMGSLTQLLQGLNPNSSSSSSSSLNLFA